MFSLEFFIKSGCSPMDTGVSGYLIDSVFSFFYSAGRESPGPGTQNTTKIQPATSY
jgi:hypothetical protein